MTDYVHCGIHAPLEDAANEIIYGSLKGVTSQSAKSDILTPWKEQDRHNREVLAAQGFVDPAVRRGMYHRAPNPHAPHLNSRDGIYRGSRTAGTVIRDDWVISSGLDGR